MRVYMARYEAKGWTVSKLSAVMAAEKEVYDQFHEFHRIVVGMFLKAGTRDMKLNWNQVLVGNTHQTEDNRWWPYSLREGAWTRPRRFTIRFVLQFWHQARFIVGFPVCWDWALPQLRAYNVKHWGRLALQIVIHSRIAKDL
jgi:hypothetical protein